MKYEQLWKDIETLCALRGPSGREAAVREYLIEQIKGHAEYEVDPLGNLLVRKKGKKPAKKVLQLSAHMDEVGFIITNIDEKGFLSFAPVGGVQPEVTGGRMVLVGDNAIPGMVGCKPVHLCDDKERSDPGKISNMKIDIGAKDKAEAEKLVSLGDMVTFTGPVVHYGEGRVAGRALDDRAGCAMLLAMIREELPCDCCFSFTVQEEVGCFGGKTAAYTLRPDIAIAVETTTAGDLAGVPEEKKVCRLGNGPVVSFMDRGTIYTYDLYKKVRALADENGIPNQTKEGVFGGNESRSLMTARGGSEVLAISIPSRYLHSPACVADERDIENTLELLRLLPGALAL